MAYFDQQDQPVSTQFNAGRDIHHTQNIKNKTILQQPFWFTNIPLFVVLIIGTLIVISGSVGVFVLTHQLKPNNFAVTDAISGTLAINEFEECDILADTTTNQLSYRLFMTGEMNHRSYGLHIVISQYQGPGTYTKPQQTPVVFGDFSNTWGGSATLVAGSITVNSDETSGSISSLLGQQFVGGTQVKITGSWKCQTIGEPVSS